MSSFLFFPRYLPCPDCGAAVDRAADEDHVCNAERRLDFQLFRLRLELARFEREFAAYLTTPAGRFEVYYAARDRALRSSSRRAA
jgi:hypothetical protein